jgi:hypothetical protein
MSLMANPRTQSQLDTPKEWILDGRMFRIKSWEIKKEEIKSLMDTIIKGEYALNQIHDKNGELKGITLLYLRSPDDVELVRTTILLTESGTELRKTSQVPFSTIPTKTIKTTAPMWVTKQRLQAVFGKYNSDPKEYDLLIDQTLTKGVKYPIVRFYPTRVDRNGKKTQVKVAYIEFSPDPRYAKDSFIALSMEHRCLFKNPISGEEALLIFDKWTVEKTEAQLQISEAIEEVKLQLDQIQEVNRGIEDQIPELQLVELA